MWPSPAALWFYSISKYIFFRPFSSQKSGDFLLWNISEWCFKGSGMCFVRLGEQSPREQKKKICVWIARRSSAASAFHFLCSLCAALALKSLAGAAWVDEWWRPLVDMPPPTSPPPHMCHRPKEPTSWTSTYSPLLLSYFSTFFLTPTFF